MKEMKTYLIVACETSYGGYHGMKDVFLVTASCDEDIMDLGVEASTGVMQSYNLFDEDYIYEYVEEDEIENLSEKEYTELEEQAYGDHIDFTAYEIDPKGKSFEELKDLLSEDEEGFIQKYQVRVL